jgi:hypothetical protein
MRNSLFIRVLRSDNPNIIPIKKQPMMLTDNVPKGNEVDAEFCITRVTINRAIPPKKLPKPINSKYFNIC